MARLITLPVLAVLVLGCSAGMLAQSTTSETSDRTIQSLASQELPDSPGALWAKSQAPATQAPASQTSSPQSNSPNNAEESAGQDKSDQKLQRPVGTAAAEAPTVSGITAAQPAGAAIAPAKQHRVRTLVLKVGAILGAGVAVGTVVALSAATPSKPPGAH